MVTCGARLGLLSQPLQEQGNLSDSLWLTTVGKVVSKSDFKAGDFFSFGYPDHLEWSLKSDPSNLFPTL